MKSKTYARITIIIAIIATITQASFASPNTGSILGFLSRESESINQQETTINGESTPTAEEQIKQELIKAKESERYIIKYKTANDIVQNNKVKGGFLPSQEGKKISNQTRISKTTDNNLKNKIKEAHPIETATKNNNTTEPNSEPNGKYEVIILEQPENIEEFIQELQSSSLGNEIEYIEVDAKMEFATSDPYFDQQWGLKASGAGSQPGFLSSIGTGAEGAWNHTTGENAVIALIDTGIDIYHEDLTDNIFVNASEIAGNGIDDDANGYIDDIHGYNFADDNNEVFNTNNPFDDQHGTHIAGIIAGAADNALGIAGTAPGAKILPLKVFKNNTAYASDIISAIAYAEAAGVKIVNCSFGSTTYSTALEEAIRGSDMLFICAAGNQGIDLTDESEGAKRVYPACYESENIISVTAIDRHGQKPAFANYGENIDIAAPGTSILSTQINGNYGLLSGTSMAAGFVSAAAALSFSTDDLQSAADIKESILSHADKLSGLDGLVNEKRILNCFNRFDPNFTEPAEYEMENVFVPENSAWEGQDDGGYHLFDGPFVGVDKIAAGNDFAFRLKADGTLWAWGSNVLGQLGDGTKASRAYPVLVKGMEQVVDVDAGTTTAMAVKSDGTVWQLGLSNTQIVGLSNIKKVACGVDYGHAALTHDGHVIFWGDSTGMRQLQNFEDIVDIDIHRFALIALKSDGTVLTYGNTTTYSLLGSNLHTLTNVVSIAAGLRHMAVVKADGSVYGWGYNGDGQLGGLPSNVFISVPAQIPGIANAAKVGAGQLSTYVIKQDGGVQAIGNETQTFDLSSLSDVSVIGGGIGYGLAMKTDGAMFSFGGNSYGQLGDAKALGHLSPYAVYSDKMFTDIKLSDAGTSLLLDNQGNVWRYGNTYDFVQVMNLPAIVGLRDNNLAVDENEDLYQITGLTAQPYTPDPQILKMIGSYRILVSGQLQYNANGTYADVSGMTDTKDVVGIYALSNSGEVYTLNGASAVQLGALSNIDKLIYGGSHYLALTSSGVVYGWGSNSHGQVGNGSWVDQSGPVHVLSGAVDIAVGSNYSLAITSGGGIAAWGWNEYGQAVNGQARTNSARPVAYSQISGAQKIVNVSDGVLVLSSAGKLYGSGDNKNGQIDPHNKPLSSANTPVKVALENGAKLNRYGVETSYDFYLTASNVQDMNGRKYLLKYPNTGSNFKIMDICGLTVPLDMTVGKIANSDIFVHEVNLMDGLIEIAFVDSDKMNGWSGIANVFKFYMNQNSGSVSVMELE